MGILYGSQLFVVGYWRLFPLDVREHAGHSYRIQRSLGGFPDFLPVIGLLPATGETVSLCITDKATGRQKFEGYDLPVDIYLKYPKVYPEKELPR